MGQLEGGQPRGVGVHGDEEHLVLYPTWLGLVASVGVPPGLLLFGWVGLSSGGSTVGAVLVALGVLTGGWAVHQFPRHVVVGPGGIARRCLLRTHHLDYGEVVAIRRAPGSRLATARALRSQDPADRARIRSGLLAVGHGRRRWMLTDQPESREEYDHLATLLVANGATALEAARPQPGAAPTSLYRRRAPSLP